jgi:thiamine-phosphate pyrophosphorylase
LLLYYITDRSQFGGDEASRRRKLLEKIAEAAGSGIDFIQLREKDLSSSELELLAHEATRTIRENSPANVARPTRLLINSRTDVAIACGAAGVHLRSDDVSPESVREVWQHNRHGGHGSVVMSVACHSVDEVRIAAENSADIVLFGPVFEKRHFRVPPNGVPVLEHACREKVPLIALGGVSLENAQSCVDAGAVGIAGIRVFQESPIAQVVRQLRGPVTGI